MGGCVLGKRSSKGAQGGLDRSHGRGRTDAKGGEVALSKTSTTKGGWERGKGPTSQSCLQLMHDIDACMRPGLGTAALASARLQSAPTRRSTLGCGTRQSITSGTLMALALTRRSPLPPAPAAAVTDAAAPTMAAAAAAAAAFLAAGAETTAASRLSSSVCLAGGRLPAAWFWLRRRSRKQLKTTLRLHEVA
eukprot:355368-Chlamydomonas_euryale.AAC.17